ncbi:hypothetical protein [Erwinia mallotivora]|uniref:Uncharacterized protein n=1 Tax=Erwinia mallotivora TaxID=69222 RepID=A0A014MAD1_9GAMM|nr:hypothetical protein [Erwinia mallotivora]EXU75044.1 hypothetical protein BG55_13915 [Erwinia mallotivora]
MLNQQQSLNSALQIGQFLVVAGNLISFSSPFACPGKNELCQLSWHSAGNLSVFTYQKGFGSNRVTLVVRISATFIYRNLINKLRLQLASPGLSDTTLLDGEAGQKMSD